MRTQTKVALGLCGAAALLVGNCLTNTLQRASKAGAFGAQALAGQPAAVDEIAVKASCSKGGFGSVMVWRLALTNKSKTATWSDVEYRTIYAGDSGTEVHRSRGMLPVTIPPGKTRTIEKYNDGFVPQMASKCAFEVTGGRRQ